MPGARTGSGECAVRAGVTHRASPMTHYSSRPSPAAQHLQDLAVELVAAVGLVLHVGAVAVEGAEAVREVPERPAPAGLPPEREEIAHPGEGHVVRGVLVRTPL